MGSLYHNYEYDDGISYPYHQLLPDDDEWIDRRPFNLIYSDPLRSLTNTTENNIHKLKRNLFKLDRKKAFDIVRWRPTDEEKSNNICITCIWYRFIVMSRVINTEQSLLFFFLLFNTQHLRFFFIIWYV